MNGSLYEISNELRGILNSAMENDGEISEEDYKRLVITRENFNEKIQDYCKAIALTKYDVDACKCEKKRINDGQQVKVNLIEKLKTRLLDAVIEFGQEKEGKNGTTYTIDAGTFKLFTKNLIKFVADEYRANLLKKVLLDYYKELFVNRVLVADEYAEKTCSEEDEINTILGAVNSIAKTIFISDVENHLVPPLPTEEWVDFTIDDLKALNLNFTFELSACDLITGGTYIAQAYCNELGLQKIDIDVKPDLSSDIENVTIGQNQVNTSLTIK